jgi:CBS domain-containing protein
MRSDPVFIDSEVSVTEAIQIMVQTGQDVLIVSDGDQIMGIVDPRVILRYTYTEGFRPNQTPVSEITNSEIIFARSNTNIEDVLAIMIEERQDTLPVVDAELVGYINIFDILKTQLHRTKTEVISPMV